MASRSADEIALRWRRVFRPATMPMLLVACSRRNDLAMLTANSERLADEFGGVWIPLNSFLRVRGRLDSPV